VSKQFRGQAEKNLLDKAVQAFAKTKLGGKMFITVIPAADKRLRALTRGHIGLGVGQPVLVLHARGAKSGQPRSSPLLYTAHGDKVLVIASKAGATSHPAWYHNCVAHPEVEIEIAGERTPMRARVAAGAEREELWAVVNDHYNGYEIYQRRAGDRVIPVVVLEPR
jgi:deazaflavin-dependent oxidoreductase (nitroreductase family)